MSTRASRLARGWLLGATATLAAAVSHGLGGGHFPSTLALVVGVVFAGLLGTLVVGRRVALWRVVVGVAGAQLAFHLLFSQLGTGATVTAGHHGPATVVGASGASVDDTGGASMWLGHAIAALVTMAILFHAERAVGGMLRPVLRAVAAWTSAPVALPRSARRLGPLVVRIDRRPAQLLAHAVSRRGPPLLAF
jgi:hypothetical protein